MLSFLGFHVNKAFLIVILNCLLILFYYYIYLPMIKIYLMYAKLL